MNKSYVLLTVLLLGILLVACNLATNSEGGTLSPEQEILKAEGKGTATAGQGILTGVSALNFTNCLDSDGNNPAVRGTIKARYIYQSRTGTWTNADNCISTNLLNEYYCDGNKPVSSRVTCPGGCSAGACKPVVATTCTGTVPANATLCYEDGMGVNVSTTNTLVATCGAAKCEYVCSAGYVLQNGACVVAPVVPTPFCYNLNSTGQRSDRPTGNVTTDQGNFTSRCINSITKSYYYCANSSIYNYYNYSYFVSSNLSCDGNSAVNTSISPCGGNLTLRTDCTAIGKVCQSGRCVANNVTSAQFCYYLNSTGGQSTRQTYTYNVTTESGTFNRHCVNTTNLRGYECRGLGPAYNYTGGSGAVLRNVTILSWDTQVSQSCEGNVFVNVTRNICSGSTNTTRTDCTQQRSNIDNTTRVCGMSYYNTSGCTDSCTPGTQLTECGNYWNGTMYIRPVICNSNGFRWDRGVTTNSGCGDGKTCQAGYCI